MFNLSKLIPIANSFVVCLGNSGSGKSSFCKILCETIDPDITVYYHNPNNTSEFELTSRQIQRLSTIDFSKSWFKKNIVSHSVLICDDFALAKSQVHDFSVIVNYFCRHYNITLFVIIHSLYKNNIFTEVNLSSHWFLLKSEASRQVAQRKQWSTAYSTLSSSKLIKQLLYINLIKEYCLTISSDISSQSLIPIQMFDQNKQIFTVHLKDAPCPDKIENDSNDESFDENIYNLYGAKNRRKVHFIISCFKKNDILKDNSVRLTNKHSMHISDVLNIFLNPFATKKPLSKQKIIFFKKLKYYTASSPLPQNVIPLSLHKYLL